MRNKTFIFTGLGLVISDPAKKKPCFLTCPSPPRSFVVRICPDDACSGPAVAQSLPTCPHWHPWATQTTWYGKLGLKKTNRGFRHPAYTPSLQSHPVNSHTQLIHPVYTPSLHTKLTVTPSLQSHPAYTPSLHTQLTHPAYTPSLHTQLTHPA